MEKEKEYNPISGYLMLTILLAVLIFGVYSLVLMPNPVFIVLLVLFTLLIVLGFVIIYPNFSSVLTLFGKYKGTIKKNGFHWVNPFFIRKRVSLRAQNFDSEKIKVNDKLGNPIQISVILVWKVQNTFKAAFEVNDYEHFVRVQTARIGYLAYAPEIASAMLRRQQATAIVSARQKIVEGAVGMVEMALEELNKKEILDLDEDRKAAMVSNLMVVLCADKDASPVINTGTLHQ
jgi:regulator of protease activity HflC (stomatin/prohibitin superfamily)